MVSTHYITGFNLDPHLTGEISGTKLNYNFRDQQLTIHLDSNKYAVSNKIFKIISTNDFGFNVTKDQLSYFHENNVKASLQIISKQQLTIEIKNWDHRKIEFVETLDHASAKAPIYFVHQ